MAEQWEMCEAGYQGVWFWLVTGFEGYSLEEFWGKFISSTDDWKKIQKQENHINKILCKLMAEGWEPFAVMPSGYTSNQFTKAFRRKVTS